jgi:hypothetical protein
MARSNIGKKGTEVKGVTSHSVLGTMNLTISREGSSRGPLAHASAVAILY